MESHFLSRGNSPLGKGYTLKTGSSGNKYQLFTCTNNPLTLMSDQDIIYPYIIDTTSIQGMRIKKNINNLEDC